MDKNIFMVVNIDCESMGGDWVTKFYRMLFKEDISKETYEECAKFKIKNMPSSLFQYTKIKHANDVLVDNKMFLRPFSWLNDPFDGNFIHNLELYKNEGVMIEVDESYKDKYQVVCFSQDNDNVPMWAFYGEDHKGICVEYDFHEVKLFRDFCFPVKYVEKTDNDVIIRKVLNDEDFSRRLEFELFLKKSQSWSYENEWRMIFNDFSAPEGFDFIMEEGKKYLKFLIPKAVYLGVKIHPKNRSYIKNLCRFRDIEVYQMIKDTSGYNLISQQIL